MNITSESKKSEDKKKRRANNPNKLINQNIYSKNASSERDNNCSKPKAGELDNENIICEKAELIINMQKKITSRSKSITYSRVKLLANILKNETFEENKNLMNAELLSEGYNSNVKRRNSDSFQNIYNKFKELIPNLISPYMQADNIPLQNAIETVDKNKNNINNIINNNYDNKSNSKDIVAEPQVIKAFSNSDNEKQITSQNNQISATGLTSRVLAQPNASLITKGEELNRAKSMHLAKNKSCANLALFQKKPFDNQASPNENIETPEKPTLYRKETFTAANTRMNNLNSLEKYSASTTNVSENKLSERNNFGNLFSPKNYSQSSSNFFMIKEHEEMQITNALVIK